jgi:hypothetical protein
MKYLANNMEELHQAVMRNLNKSVGHEVSDDVVWGKVMEILRKSCKLVQLCWPYNCPSNQKTGHKKSINDDVSKKRNKTNQTLTIWLMSTVMKYLQKRTYDISGELHEASSLTTISTCKCGFFGGLSNLTSKNLSECYGGRMTINSLR